MLKKWKRRGGKEGNGIGMEEVRPAGGMEEEKKEEGELLAVYVSRTVGINLEPCLVAHRDFPGEDGLRDAMDVSDFLIPLALPNSACFCAADFINGTNRMVVPVHCPVDRSQTIHLLCPGEASLQTGC